MHFCTLHIFDKIFNSILLNSSKGLTVKNSVSTFSEKKKKNEAAGQLKGHIIRKWRANCQKYETILLEESILSLVFASVRQYFKQTVLWSFSLCIILSKPKIKRWQSFLECLNGVQLPSQKRVFFVADSKCVPFICHQLHTYVVNFNFFVFCVIYSQSAAAKPVPRVLKYSKNAFFVCEHHCH